LFHDYIEMPVDAFHADIEMSVDSGSGVGVSGLVVGTSTGVPIVGLVQGKTVSGHLYDASCSIRPFFSSSTFASFTVKSSLSASSPK